MGFKRGAPLAGLGALTADSISRLTMRPPGPLPFTDLRLIPASAAMRAAIGDISCLPSSREVSGEGFPSVGDDDLAAVAALCVGLGSSDLFAAAGEPFAGWLSTDLSKAEMSSSASPMIAMGCPSGAV